MLKYAYNGQNLIKKRIIIMRNGLNRPDTQGPQPAPQDSVSFAHKWDEWAAQNIRPSYSSNDVPEEPTKESIAKSLVTLPKETLLKHIKLHYQLHPEHQALLLKANFSFHIMNCTQHIVKHHLVSTILHIHVTASLANGEVLGFIINLDYSLQWALNSNTAAQITFEQSLDNQIMGQRRILEATLKTETNSDKLAMARESLETLPTLALSPLAHAMLTGTKLAVVTDKTLTQQLQDLETGLTTRTGSDGDAQTTATAVATFLNQRAFGGGIRITPKPPMSTTPAGITFWREPQSEFYTEPKAPMVAQTPPKDPLPARPSLWTQFLEAFASLPVDTQLPTVSHYPFKF